MRTELSLLALFACAACAAPDDRGAPFDRRSLPEPAPASPRPPVERRGRIEQPLTLDEALEIALEANPALDAVAESVNAAKARIEQAGVFTNPTFTFGKDDF